MSKIKVSEIFDSLQSEGYWMGQPSVFLRTFGCNFTCPQFGLPKGFRSNEPDKIAEVFFKENPGGTIHDLPTVATGCDSYHSWHPKFKSLSPTLDIPSIVSEIEHVRIEGTKLAAMPLRNNGDTHLVITGGEPLLGWQRAYPELLTATFKKGYKHVTFETNGTKAISEDFANFLLTSQLKTKKKSSLTFSVSPKLSCSGEPIEKALLPDVVADYQRYGMVYLKFVVSCEEDMPEVVKFVRAYRKAGFRGDVYLMPCGGEPELYNKNSTVVANLARQYRYRYSPRLQVTLWDNAHGT